MHTPNREALDTVTARFFMGLGDPTRLRILDFLQQGERSAGEIVQHLELPQNQVSMHLGCLRWCGYVTTRRDGRYIFYALADSRVRRIVSLAHDLLSGSEVYLLACEVLGGSGEADENLANITGWLNRAKTSEGASVS